MLKFIIEFRMNLGPVMYLRAGSWTNDPARADAFSSEEEARAAIARRGPRVRARAQVIPFDKT